MQCDAVQCSAVMEQNGKAGSELTELADGKTCLPGACLLKRFELWLVWFVREVEMRLVLHLHLQLADLLRRVGAAAYDTFFPASPPFTIPPLLLFFSFLSSCPSRNH